MKKILDSIKYIKAKDLISPFIFLIVLPISIIFKLYNKIKRRHLWLICEGETTARDNGYHFYKYIKEMHPDQYCFYVIDKKSDDYNKVKNLGNIIQFKSFKHWVYYLSAEYNISSQKNGNPNQPFFYLIHVTLGLYKNRVFLQHGITKDDSKWLYYKNTKFRYFICGAKREYEYIKKTFGYPSGNVIYTGFPRFDNLYENQVKSNQILIIPTWRSWLGRETNKFGEKIKFTETEFYKHWNSFLSNEILKNYIEKNNYIVYFYPHFNMQKYIKYFKINSNNIKIINDIEIQKLLKESAYMITDYSSVYMDFAYMKKPVLYFQFDYDEYREKQYKNGYFDYQNDGFGPVIYTENELVESLINILENGIQPKYLKRMQSFFELRDQKNCERIYNKLKSGDK